MSLSIGALATFAYSQTGRGHASVRRASSLRTRWYIARLRDGVRLWESPSRDVATAKCATENADAPGTYVVERVRS